MELLPGANAALPTGPISIEVTWQHAVGVDVSALLLDSGGSVRGDADMVFFNNPRSEAGAVRLTIDGGAARVDLEPEVIPADVERVAIVAAIDVDAPAGTTFAQVAGLRAVASTGTGPGTFAFAIPDLHRGETAMVLAEVYRHGGNWKIRAIGQGYASGLAGVAADFGVDIAGNTTGTGPPTPSPAAVATAQPPPALRRIDLDKGASATIALDKNLASGVLTATLEWDGGSADRRDQGADLDLYALYITRHDVTDASAATIARSIEPQNLPKSRKRVINRAKNDPRHGAVYWNHLGSATEPPYMALDRDAVIPGIETVRITVPRQQGFVLICAYSAIDNGLGSFKSYGAKAVVSDGRGTTVTAPLYHDNDLSYWVAIALVDFTVADGVAIHHVETYSDGSYENRPVLFPDGSFAMDVGPVEFKPGTFDR
ncbi:TerD family protein [Embleya sp. NPDC056575]|uniref:TerD family protein n=1 Tax=unclassified Embleya TaxID=2699296 RepID=UPI00367F4F06